MTSITPDTVIHFGLCPVEGLNFDTASLAWDWADAEETGCSKDIGLVDADVLRAYLNDVKMYFNDVDDNMAYHGTIVVKEAMKIVAQNYGYSLGVWGSEGSKEHPLYDVLQGDFSSQPTSNEKSKKAYCPK